MTTEIHTCSYECDRPECIRAQRDELAGRMTAETSNAREWPERYACNGPEGTFWTDDAALANKLIAAAFDRDEWTVTDTQNPTGATPPPPADAQLQGQESGGEVIQRHVVTKYRDGSVHVADVAAAECPHDWGQDEAHEDWGRCYKCGISRRKPLAQQPAAVDEAMVERARAAYYEAAEVKDGVFTVPSAMRAALTAALTEDRNG